MKNLLNLEGVKSLSKMEQKNINGGYVFAICADGTELTGLANCDNAFTTICGAYGGAAGGICVGPMQ